MIGVGGRSIRSDHGGVEVSIRRTEMIEDESSIIEVCECEGAEADELEGEELRLAMTGDY